MAEKAKSTEHEECPSPPVLIKLTMGLRQKQLNWRAG